MSWRLVVDIVGFQIAWWASALGAAAGRWEPGAAAGLVVVAAQLVMAGERVALIATLIVAGLLGFVAESALIASGVVSYAAPWPVPGLAPIWLVMLWVVFATCIEATARMLGRHAKAKSVVLGAIIAPPTYWAGARLDALSLAEPWWLPMAAFALVWMIAMPLLLATYERLAGVQQRSAA